MSVLFEDREKAMAGVSDYSLNKDKSHDPAKLKMRVSD
jgi:hypothetical protein